MKVNLSVLLDRVRLPQTKTTALLAGVFVGVIVMSLGIYLRVQSPSRRCRT